MTQKVYRDLLEVMKSRGGPYAGLDIPEFFVLVKELFDPEEAEINNILITEARPLLKVQAYFSVKVLSLTDEVTEQGNYVAVLVIKPVKRSTRSPHGLIVIEYRQSSFQNKTEGS